ncbi:MAG TPA: hypothetical protein VL053_01380 [Arachidicoccus sp.]|nr:hypothetical protein [Arachidicoccus sp.]
MRIVVTGSLGHIRKPLVKSMVLKGQVKLTDFALEFKAAFAQNQ